MNLKSAIVFAQKKFKEKSIPSASLDAEVLLLEAINLEHKIKKDRSWIYLYFEKYTLSKKEEKIFLDFVKRREKNEPIAYILQRKEFYGLDFFVNKDTLIPREETEIIVEETIEIIKNSQEKFSILDIGTGSGCIPISILDAARKKNLGNKIKKTFANDISAPAIKVARINAKKNKLSSKITFLEKDLEKALKHIQNCKNIIITANLPYISIEDYKKLGPNVRNFEPKLALTAKEKGLFHIRRLLEKFAAISQNFNSYYILLEIDPKQTKEIKKIVKKELSGSQIKIIKDLRGRQRIIKICTK